MAQSVIVIQLKSPWPNIDSFGGSRKPLCYNLICLTFTARFIFADHSLSLCAIPRPTRIQLTFPATCRTCFLERSARIISVPEPTRREMRFRRISTTSCFYWIICGAFRVILWPHFFVQDEATKRGDSFSLSLSRPDEEPVASPLNTGSNRLSNSD